MRGLATSQATSSTTLFFRRLNKPPKTATPRIIMASAQQVRGIELASSSQRTDLTVVLVCPQIPGNTGTIARTCAATQVPLHLVGPLGFELDDTRLKRAGLDYWQSVCVKVHESYEAFYRYWQEIEESKRGRLVAFSKFGGKSHCAKGA